MTLDPNQPGLVYAKILGCDGLAPLTEDEPPPVATTTTIPLGIVTNGDTTTTYMGEFADYEGTVSATDGTASATPEPSSLWLGASGLALLGWRRFRRRSGQPAP
jgi:MYXO-CTERM domain-containing protein